MPRGKHNGHKRGTEHPRYNANLRDSQGYELVRLPGHPKADSNGYVRGHILAMEAQLGRPLVPGELVHHDNDVKDDNVPGNLLLKTRATHNQHHNLTSRGRDAHGRFTSTKTSGAA